MARESVKRGQFQPSLKAHTGTHTHVQIDRQFQVGEGGASRYWPVCRYIRRPDPALGRIVRLALEKNRARDEFDNSSGQDPHPADLWRVVDDRFLSSSLKSSSPLSLRFSNDL